MRFNYDAAQPGVQNLTRAFASPTRQNAADMEMMRLAGVDQKMASTEKSRAEADILNQRQSYLGDPVEFLSNQTGAPQPLARKFSEYQKSGNWGTIPPSTEVDDEGNPLSPTTITETPKEISPLMDKFVRALQTYGAVRGASMSNPEQIAKSHGEFQQQGVTDNVQDLIGRGEFDTASARNQGGKIGQQIKRFDDIGATGAVYNPATGDVAATGNPLVNAFIKETISGGSAPKGHRPADPSDKNQKITDTERTTAGYASRMEESEKILATVKGGQKPGLAESAAAMIPLAGKIASNMARTPERQKYRQAQEDWVRAKLRKESGAVIADEEMDREIRVYFPQIGDGQDVIAQKEQSRQVAMDAMQQAAGPAYGVRHKNTDSKPGVVRYDRNGNRL